jgi:hypothetical protein
VLGLSFLLVISLQTEVLESQLRTPSGLIERYKDQNDERRFGVKLIRKDKSEVWLEEFAPQTTEKIKREKLMLFSGGVYDSIILESDGEKKAIGLSLRQFDKSSKLKKEYGCFALSGLAFPTPLNEESYFFLHSLKCSPDSFEPLSEFSFAKVVGSQEKTWIKCQKIWGICYWGFDYNDKPEAAAQNSALNFLSLIKSQLDFYRIKPFVKKTKIYTRAFNSNRSFYNAESRTAFFGTGDFDDSLDGFIVVHEWSHSLIDDLNPGLWGYSSQVVHEALSDYMASQLYDNFCFAPWEAKEFENKECLRNLKNDLSFPEDMTWDDSHADSLILSGALWELREEIAPEIILELVLETLIRLPKEFELPYFWKKLSNVYSRIENERKIKSNAEFLLEVGRRRGLSAELVESP